MCCPPARRRFAHRTTAPAHLTARPLGSVTAAQPPSLDTCRLTAVAQPTAPPPPPGHRHPATVTRPPSLDTRGPRPTRPPLSHRRASHRRPATAARPPPPGHQGPATVTRHPGRDADSPTAQPPPPGNRRSTSPGADSALRSENTARQPPPGHPTSAAAARRWGTQRRLSGKGCPNDLPALPQRNAGIARTRPVLDQGLPNPTVSPALTIARPISTRA
jgi:hypothetical protein